MRQHHRPVDASIGASGPHDFAVRFKRPSSESAEASTASRPTFVTMANVPLSGETGAILPVICGSDQSRDLRRINTTGKSRKAGESESSAKQLPHRCNCEPTGRANARPMTGSAKQSSRSTKRFWIASSLSLLAMTVEYGRHARPCAGHPRLTELKSRKT
jgi:hypothetical protein